MKAVVLAAGKGKRLWPLTENKPKPLLPIANKPILEWTIRALVESGLPEILLVIGHGGEKIRGKFGDGSKLGCKIEYVNQKSQKGTADAVGSVQSRLESEDRFLVIYGDDYYQKSALKGFLSRAEKNDGMSMATAQAQDASPFGSVEVKSGVVQTIKEKSSHKHAGLVNAAIYLLAPSIFARIDETRLSERKEFELTDSLKIAIRRGERLHSEQLGDGDWFGISYPWDLLEANRIALTSANYSQVSGNVENGVHIRGPIEVGEGSLIKEGSRLEGPILVGKDCDIGPNAYLRAHSSLADGVKVGASCEVKNTIVMANTRIPHLSYVGDSVLGEDCSLGAGTITANLRFDEAHIRSKIDGQWASSGRRKLGAILGDNVKTGVNVSLFPGVKVGSGAWIGPGASVENDIPSGTKRRAG